MNNFSYSREGRSFTKRNVSEVLLINFKICFQKDSLKFFLRFGRSSLSFVCLKLQILILLKILHQTVHFTSSTLRSIKSSHLCILSRAECLLLCCGCFLISFRLLGDVGFERCDKLIKAFSSFSMLCVWVTAIDGVGLTTPVGVVVEATDVAGFIVDRHVVCVVVETVALKKSSLLVLCKLDINGC